MPIKWEKWWRRWVGNDSSLFLLTLEQGDALEKHIWSKPREWWYSECGVYCHRNRSWISHPEEMHVKGVQGTNRLQKSLNDFVEERAHRGTTQTCLEAFSSEQSAQMAVDGWSSDGTEEEGSLLFGLSPDCLHWKPAVRLDRPWLWSNSASTVSVSGII